MSSHLVLSRLMCYITDYSIVRPAHTRGVRHIRKFDTSTNIILRMMAQHVLLCRSMSVSAM
eukprot:scaffold211748_cov18-Prasinocladus_malaysianus.AAC.1